MRVLVTGGAGFIGSHLVDAFLRAGHRVRVLDDFSSGSRDNLRNVKDDVEIIRGDCADPRAAARATKGMEAVFHEGAVPSVALSVREPALSHRANATATLNMLIAARDGGVRRFVYAGSSSVYGDTPKLPKVETLPTRPLSPYAVGKASGEHYVRIFASLYGLETLTLRYFNVFGPRQAASSPYSGVISLFAKALFTGKTPVIFGDGKQSRDFTYVENVVEANRLALRTRGLRGQVVNVAMGERVTLNHLLSGMATIVGKRVHPEYRPTRAGDVRHSLADIRLARKLLGYRPVVDFETGLRRTVDWYRALYR